MKDTNNLEGTGKVGDPSPEAISHAKRMIALKWTKETNIDTIAGTWQAGYVAAQLDAQKPSFPPDPDVQKAAEEYGRNHPFVEYIARKEGFLAGTQWKGEEVEALKKEIERLKTFIESRERSTHYTFYTTVTSMTERQIDEQFQKRWQQFKIENNL